MSDPRLLQSVGLHIPLAFVVTLNTNLTNKLSHAATRFCVALQCED